ncbi:MAG: hypothetical protein LH466_09080 [Sphingomonas bacterium]|nr:hypothetical protein [Sphingomonas bacterium]
MIHPFLIRATLAGTAMMMSAPAAAQENPTAAAGAVDGMQAQIQLLQAQVEALQEALAQVKSSMTKVAPSWKGAPLVEDKEAGWSFKPRGRLQYDVGYVSNPNESVVTRNLGFNTRARRIRLGAEGTIPGGLGYKVEMDFANAGIGFGDAILTYSPKNAPIVLTIGNHETLNGIEQITSSRFSSFVERAAFDDAFINTRRLGISAGYANKAGDLRVNAGLFAAHSIDSSLDGDGWIGAARATYSPLMGANQLHFGVNYQHREFQSNNGATAATASGQPSTNQLARYRARPFSQLTDQRFVDTQNFAAKSDDIIGVEAAGVFKSLHLAAEGQYLRTNAYGAGHTVTFSAASDDPVDVLDLFPSANQFVSRGNPAFWGGYVEAGYFLTGESRGYKVGQWDRTKVLKPFSKGGIGAFQVIARADYLDLDSSKLRNGCTNNFLTGICVGGPQLQKGGKQLGFLAGLTWIPEDYMRVLLNYSHASIEGGPLAATVEPTTPSSEPIDERKYGVDAVQARFQIDF